MTCTTLEFPVPDDTYPLSVIQKEEVGGGKALSADGCPNNWTHQAKNILLSSVLCTMPIPSLGSHGAWTMDGWIGGM